MSEVQKAVRTALVATVVTAGALVAETIWIADPDLRYPIVLLTKILGIIIGVIFIARVLLLVVKEKVLATAPHAYARIQNLGKVMFATAASLMGCAFGASILRDKSGVIEYVPLGIALIFGGMAALGLRYLWREWITYRRWRGEQERGS
jgi:hypothetical protein